MDPQQLLVEPSNPPCDEYDPPRQLEHVHGHNYTLPCSNVNANYYGNLQVGPVKAGAERVDPILPEATKALYVTYICIDIW